MIEFFNSIWTWVVQNANEIVVTITSANFITFISTIVLLIKTMKSTKDNTTSTNTLNENLVKVDEMITKLNMLSAKLDELLIHETDIKEMLSKSIKGNESNEELINLLTVKINYMLDAQLIVWSTIKDDNIRNNVNNLLTTAKLKETSTINEMKEKLEQLKEELVNKTNELSNYVKDTEIKVTVPDIKHTKNKNTVTRV